MSGHFRCEMERQIGITREKKQEKLLRIVAGSGKSVTFAPATRKKVTVPWMSGLVSGLQNRVRRFESARYLNPPQKPC